MATGKVAEIGNTWSGWAKILATVFAGLTLLGAGGYVNTEIWQSKRLAYTIMPAEERQGHFSNGLTIENRGRMTLTDVQIIIGGLGVPIEAVQLPEVHQPATVVDGGEGFDHVRIDMPRLSPDHALTGPPRNQRPNHFGCGAPPHCDGSGSGWEAILNVAPIDAIFALVGAFRCFWRDPSCHSAGAVVLQAGCGP